MLRLRLGTMITLTLALAFTACTSGDDDDDDDDDVIGDDDDDDDDDLVDAGPSGGGDPRTGQWSYDEYDVTGGDCDLAQELNADGGFALENHGDGSFTITPGDGTDPFDCTVDDGDFTCPDRGTATYEEPGLDAELAGTASADGAFADDEHGAGQQTVEVTCSGADCAAVELATGVDFPCQFVADFEIAWEAP